MYLRTGRRSGYHDQEEPDIISPQAARLNGDGLSGPRRPVCRLASGLSGRTGPRAPLPNDGARRGDDFGDIFENEEAEPRRRPHAGGRHHHDAAEEAGFSNARPSARRHNNVSELPNRRAERDDGVGYSGAFFGSRNSVRGRQHDHAEDDEGSEEDGVDLGRHDCTMGYRQNHAEFDGSKNGARPGYHDRGGGGRRHDHAEDNDALEAAGTRPSRHNPTGQLQRDRHGDREASEDNERHGDLRRGRGDRVRNRSDEAYEHPDLRPSGGLIGGGHTPQDDGNSQEQQGRFISYTFRMLHPEHVKFLVKVFKVRTSKVKEWCEADYIRMDNSRNFETNIDPLLSTLTSGDRELYAKALQRKQNEKEIRKIVGWGPKHATTAFDRGYEAGQASRRREHKAERHGQS